MTSQHSLGHYGWLHNGNFVFFSAWNLEIITMIYNQWWSFVWWHRGRRNRNFNMTCCYSSSSTRIIWEKVGAFSSVSCIAFENMMIEPTGLNPCCTKSKILSSVTPFWLMPASNIKDPLSISDKTSYHKFPWSLEATRFVFRIVQSPWNVTGTQQQCCWGTCQISELCDNLNYQFCCFEFD